MLCEKAINIMFNMLEQYKEGKTEEMVFDLKFEGWEGRVKKLGNQKDKYKSLELFNHREM